MHVLKVSMGVAAVAAGVGAVLLAQGPVPKPTPGPKRHGLITFSTNVGSFKMKQRGDDAIEGVLDMNFTGTVLISGLKGNIVPTGNVRMEYYDAQHNKRIFFGTGHLKLDGEFRNVQWFGREMNGSFNGFGIIEFRGEYDKNLQTGFYTLNGVKKPWGSQGQQVVLPYEERKMPMMMPPNMPGGPGGGPRMPMPSGPPPVVRDKK